MTEEPKTQPVIDAQKPGDGGSQSTNLEPLIENPKIKTGTAPIDYFVASDGTVHFDRTEALDYESGRQDAGDR